MPTSQVVAGRVLRARLVAEGAPRSAVEPLYVLTSAVLGAVDGETVHALPRRAPGTEPWTVPLSYLLQDVSWVFLAVAVVLAVVAAARFSRPLAAKCAGDRYVAAALILYCGVLVAFTCAPRRDTPMGMGFSTFSEGLRFSLRPDVLTMELKSPLSGLEEMANLTLFAPFGFLLFWLTRKPIQAVLVSASLSVVIEIWQGFVGRSMDVGDVLHNALGAAVGVGMGWLGSRWIDTKEGRSTQLRPVKHGTKGAPGHKWPLRANARKSPVNQDQQVRAGSIAEM